MKAKYLLMAAGIGLSSLETPLECSSGLKTWLRSEFTEVLKEKDTIHAKIDSLQVSSAKKVFITLDDGPNRYTKDILKMLDSLWQKATFFRVGQNIDTKYRSVANDIVKQWHELGSHSYRHENFRNYHNLSWAQESIEKTEQNFEKIGHLKTKYFRYPYGEKVKQGLNSDFLTYLQKKGYQKPVFWDIDTRDWDKKTSREKMKQSLLKVKPGDIILLHENKRALGETLILIDSILDAKNLQSAPLSEKFKKN